MTSNSPIACHSDALSVEQQSRRKLLANRLLNKVKEVQELDSGYAFLYPLQTQTWMEIAEFVDLERQCCPFISISIDLDTENRAVWIRFIGEKGVKDFLQNHEDFAV